MRGAERTTLRSRDILTRFITLLFITLPLCGTVALVCIEPVTAGPAKEPQSGRLIVKIRNKTSDLQHQVSAVDVRRVAEKMGVRLRRMRALSGGAELVETPGPQTPEQLRRMARQLAELPEVEYAEPDVRRYPDLLPNDPEFANQTYLTLGTTDNVEGIDAPGAWEATTGSSATIVAVVDSGILPDHADVAGRTLPGYDFISEDGDGAFFAANDGDGRDPDPSDPGDHVEADQCGSGAPAADSGWHGTRVASLLAAIGDDGQGMAGVDWNVWIVPVRALGRCGGFVSDINDAVRWAAGLVVPGAPPNPTPAKVINLSLGGEGQCMRSEQAAIDDALAAGAIVVVSAGNESTNALRSAPASCSGVITIGATRFDGGLAGFSNYGLKETLSAPGTDLLSAANRGTAGPVDSPGGDIWNPDSGTSFSTPLVSGVASLMLSLNADLTASQVVGTMRATARDFPASSSQACHDPLCGTGILNAAGAVQAVEQGDVVEATDGGNGVLNALSQAIQLPAQGTLGASLETPFEFDTYRVLLTENGTLTVSTLGPSDPAAEPTDTYGYLFSADGQLLAQGDDIDLANNNTNFRLEENLSVGTYFVGVEGFNRRTSGEYSIQTAFVPDATNNDPDSNPGEGSPNLGSSPPGDGDPGEGIPGDGDPGDGNANEADPAGDSSGGGGAGYAMNLLLVVLLLLQVCCRRLPSLRSPKATPGK